MPCLTVVIRRPASPLRKVSDGHRAKDTDRWGIGGTDLGIPYLLENGSVGFLFGDTFNTRWWNDPPLPNDWRSPVMPYSSGRESDLHLMVSRWLQAFGQSHAYDVTHWVGSA